MRRRALCVFFVGLSLLGCTTSTRRFRVGGPLEGHKPPRVVVAPRPPRDEPMRSEPPPPLAVPAQPRLEAVVERLPNGVELVMIERASFPTVATIASVATTDAEPGAPWRFLQAILSRDDEAWQAHDRLRYLGAHASGMVSREHLTLTTTSLAPFFRAATKQQAELLATPQLSSSALRHADAAALQASDALRRAPHRMASVRLAEALFGDASAWAAPLSGRLEAVATTPRSGGDHDVEAFRERYVRGPSVRVVCVGAASPSAMRATLSEHFAALPGGSTTPFASLPPSPPPPPPSRGRRTQLIDRPGAPQTFVLVGARGPRATDPDAPAAEVLAAALGSSLGSRITSSVRVDMGATYGVDAAAKLGRLAGTFEIATWLDATRTGDALTRLLSELTRAADEPLTAAELATARAKTRPTLETSTAQRIASYVADEMAMGVSIRDVLDHDARVSAVEAADVQRVAKRYLTPDALRIVVVGDARLLRAELESIDHAPPSAD